MGSLFFYNVPWYSNSQTLKIFVYNKSFTTVAPLRKLTLFGVQLINLLYSSRSLSFFYKHHENNVTENEMVRHYFQNLFIIIFRFM